MVVRKNRDIDGNIMRSTSQSSSPNYPKKKDYSYNNWERTEIEDIWETNIAIIEKSQRKYFKFLNVVLKEDIEKITYFIKNIANNYSFIKDAFTLSDNILPQDVMAIEVIDFVMKDYDKGKDASCSDLSKRKIKHDEIAVIKPTALPVIENRFELFMGLSIDKTHQQFIDKDKMETIIKVTTIGDLI